MRVISILALAAALAPAASTASGKPLVRFVSFAPATVAGTGFHARERVGVTVSSRSTRLHLTVRATAAGRFTARFGRPARTSPCDQVVVVAVGETGDRAAWKTVPQPCPPPLQPVTR